jgi:hypothetical protein
MEETGNMLEMQPGAPGLPNVARATRRKRLFHLVGIGMAAVILCPILVQYGRVWIPRAWGNLRFVNYFVAFIPTILSILFAFVVDKDLGGRVKFAWRVGIVTCGFLYSVALWHQQVLTDKSILDTQSKIVNDAVSQANQHSDEQTKAVRQDVQGVKSDLSDLKADLHQSTSDITSGLGRIKPEPPKRARLQVSLFREDLRVADLPMLRSSITADNDGVVPIDIFLTNVSDTPAEVLEMWLGIPKECTFTEEPRGSDKPEGTEPAKRHFIIPGILNAGASYQKTTLKLKCPTGVPPYNLAVDFKYSCKTCGAMEANPQRVTVTVLPQDQTTPAWQK